MNPRVKDVKPGDDYTLFLVFENREKKIFDVKPYLNFGIFSELKDKDYFNLVKVSLGTIQWPNGQDFCPDTLFEEGVLNKSSDSSMLHQQEDIINRLEFFIHKNGLKQYEVAEMLDCSRATFNRWLKRKHVPTKSWQINLERFLNNYSDKQK